MELVKRLALLTGLGLSTLTGLELKAEEHKPTYEAVDVHKADGSIVLQQTVTDGHGYKVVQEIEKKGPTYSDDSSTPQRKFKLKRNKFGISEQEDIYHQHDKIEAILKKQKGNISPDLEKEAKRVYLTLFKYEMQANKGAWTTLNQKLLPELCQYGVCDKDPELLVYMATYTGMDMPDREKLLKRAFELNSNKARKYLNAVWPNAYESFPDLAKK